MPTQTIVKKITGKNVPVLKSRVSTKQFKLSKDEECISNDVQRWLKRKQSLWQSDNLNPFLDREHSEEVNLVLSTNNPQLPNNLVEFCYKEKNFIPVNSLDQNITLLDVEGTCICVSADATERLEVENIENEEKRSESAVCLEKNLSKDKEKEDEESVDDVDEDDLKEIKEDKDYLVHQQFVKKTKKLMNQFNFCERATVTYENFFKHIKIQTNPPDKINFADYVTQWIIYDSYQEDYELQKKEKEKGKKEKSVILKKDDSKKKLSMEKTDVINANILKKIQILERMINQNIFDDILQDFRYYEDPSDEFRNSEGTLLPLWKFRNSEIKKLYVTDIKWNPRYFDLFAVSFGTHDFQKQNSKGCLCLWSLKNPCHPEYFNNLQFSVVTLDFHQQRPYLIVVGSNDGSVAVYDSRLATKLPICQSNHVDNKHNGIIWQVLWGEDLSEGELTFYSVSSDGNVFNWILLQNHLARTLIISLSLRPESIYSPDQNREKLRGCGTCIALHPLDHSIFLVGTEEGFIYKCSTAYLSMYLFIYEAHHMPVYCIDYNKYSPDIFVSCSADWSIKIWEDNRKEPLFIFNTNSSVNDVKWAPYSSTVLAAVTLDCKACVFDLNVDKYKAICTQTIASKKLNKLSKIAFNWKLPVVIIGDDKGVVQIFKLSPNLRIKPKITKKQSSLSSRELEIMKLEKVLSLIREPTELSLKLNDAVRSEDYSSLS